jgi:hypothetical protein
MLLSVSEELKRLTPVIAKLARPRADRWPSERVSGRLMGDF